MATHSSILAWRIPWTEKPGRLQSMGSQSGGGHVPPAGQPGPPTLPATSGDCPHPLQVPDFLCGPLGLGTGKEGQSSCAEGLAGHLGKPTCQVMWEVGALSRVVKDG